MPRRHRWSAALSVVALASLALAIYSSFTPLDWRLGPVRIGAGTPVRAGVLAILASLGMVTVSWHRAAWRRVAVALTLICALVALALSTHGAAPQVPVSDAAFIELYTRHAMHGRQLLGPYSQFGWFHPGPMLFYFLAAFYGLGSQSMNSINAGAFAINFLSLVLIAWVCRRHGAASYAFTMTLWAAVAIFCVRVPDLLASAWNPHVPVLPLLATMVLASGVALGDPVLLPSLALVASFVVQSHVGFAPTALAVAATGSLTLAARSMGDFDARRASLRWLLAATAVLEVVWLLPVAEQVTSPDGNMSRIARFFFSSTEPAQTWRTAWNVWTRTLLASFSPDFKIPVGVPLDTAANPACGILAIVLVLGLLATAALSGRTRRFERAVASICLVACAAGLWAVHNVRALIGDYHVFWLSIVGLASVAVVAAAVLSSVTVRAGSLPLRNRTGRVVTALAPIVVIGAVAATGVSRLQHERTTATLEGESGAARELAQAIAVKAPSLGSRPMIRIEPARWSVGAGILVELDKAGLSFGVDEPADLAGPRLATRGTEDVLIVICGPERHAQLARDPRVRELGSSRGDVHADAVRFAEAPEYRHER